MSQGLILQLFKRLTVMLKKNFLHYQQGIHLNFEEYRLFIHTLIGDLLQSTHILNIYNMILVSPQSYRSRRNKTSNFLGIH